MGKIETRVLWKPQGGPQTEFHARREDVVLYGGAKGGGKTDSLLAECQRQVHIPSYKGLLLRRNFPRLQEILDRAHQMFPKFGARWAGAEHRYVFPSGAIIQFGHCQNEMDKFNYQGQEFHFIGFDQLEEFTESQFDFICMQNRTTNPDIKCYIRATANPGGPGHQFVKRRFIDGKDPRKTYFQKFTLPDGRILTRTSCFIPATVYDNKILMESDPGYVARLMSNPSEIEQRAYLHGDWNAFSSQCVFNPVGMQNLERKIMDPNMIGRLEETKTGYQMIGDPDGLLKVWHSPEAKLEYVLSIDVAMGDSEGNDSSIDVINKLNWEQVAHWYGKCTPIELGRLANQLGHWYNLAEISVELPGPGVATVGYLKEIGYPHIYHYDKDKPGWLNNERARANMLSTLMDAVRDGSLIVRDRVTLDQMYNFIRHESGKIKAREGCNDDAVMSLGIGIQCIRINPFHEPSAHSRRIQSPVTSIIRTPGKYQRRRAAVI